MNPLIASGIVSLGQKFINNIMTPNSSTAKVDGASFAEHLSTDTSVEQSPLVDFLKTNNVSNASELKDLSVHLSNQLRNHPELAEKLSGVSADEEIRIVKQDGFYSLRTSKGQIAAINADSELGQLAEHLQQLTSVSRLSDELPSSNIYQLANKVAAEPILNDSWVLRAGVVA